MEIRTRPQPDIGKKLVLLMIILGIVVLVLVPFMAFAGPPTVIWVGSEYTEENCGGHIWGVDAFATIEEAINAANDGVLIYVTAGNYVEQGEIEVTKPITIRGANSSRNGSYSDNTIVSVTPVDGATHCDTIFWVHDTESVTISGLTLDRNGTSQTGVVFTGGCDFKDSTVKDCKVTGERFAPDDNCFIALEAIQVDNVTFKNNIVEGIINADEYDPGTYYDGGIGEIGGCEGIVIEGNVIDGLGEVGHGLGNGISCVMAGEVTIANNIITGCHYGIYENQVSLDIKNNEIYENDIGVQCGAWTMALHQNEIYDNPISISCGYTVEEQVDATLNYWGLNDAGAIEASFDGNVLFIPWAVDTERDSSGDFIHLYTTPVTGISLNKTETSIQVGLKETLKATLAPADASVQKVIWSSSAESTATVDQTGKVTGVALGIATITAKTEDGGFEAHCQVTVIPRVNSSGPLSPDDTSDETGIDISVNGDLQGGLAKASVTSQDGKTVATVTVDPDKLAAKLAKADNDAFISITVNQKFDAVIGELTGQTVKDMENKNATLEIRTPDITYVLPAQEIKVNDIAQSLGEAVSFADIKVKVTIADASEADVEWINDEAAAGNYSIVVPPVEFTVTATYGDKSVTVTDFNHYVSRLIKIPTDVDPTKITTGIMRSADGAIRHVPTEITEIDGVYYAKINSLTNSVYSVIWNPKTFRDVAGHWAEAAINEAGARLIVFGVDQVNYQPDRSITRAEYAAVMVRALGLSPKANDQFTDVASDAWYAGCVGTANQYGIVAGVSDSLFEPNRTITREEAMAMTARAAKIAGMDTTIKTVEVAAQLAKFQDGDKVSDWAEESTAYEMKIGLVVGEAGFCRPQDPITRAEVATMVLRLLQKANLIDARVIV